MNAPLALARPNDLPPRSARPGVDAPAGSSVVVRTGLGPVPEPARPVSTASSLPLARPSLDVLQSRIGAALGTEAFPAVLLAVLQQVYPTGPVALRWGTPEGRDADTHTPWLQTDDVSIWLPAGAGDEDLRGWLTGLIAAQREITRGQNRVDFLTRLVSVLAHEVRNPLTVVMGTLELAGRDESLTAAVRNTLAAARRTAARIDSVTRAATDLARGVATTDPSAASSDHFSLKQALTAVAR